MEHVVLGIVEKYVGHGREIGDGNYLTTCPFHKGGGETSPSFSINLRKAVFICFSCKVKGSVHKLLTMLGVPADEADKELQEIRDEIVKRRRAEEREREVQWRFKDPYESPFILPEKIVEHFVQARKNSPKDPTLLVSKGFKKRVLTKYGIGFDEKKQRVTYPIRDLYGNLAGISGGTIIPGTEPKYLIYRGALDDPDSARYRPSDFGEEFDRKFVDYQCNKSNYLWNYHNLYHRLNRSRTFQPLIIVEGFKAALWLLQHGYENTVALMTSHLSFLQTQQLLRVRCRILLLLDNDLPGQLASAAIYKALIRKTPRVKVVNYPKGRKYDHCQPDDLSKSVLEEMLADYTGEKNGTTTITTRSTEHSKR